MIIDNKLGHCWRIVERNTMGSGAGPKSRDQECSFDKFKNMLEHNQWESRALIGQFASLKTR